VYEQVKERDAIEPGQLVMPFYIVCDVSYSMVNDMPALNDALQGLRLAILNEPVVDDVGQVGVITFSDSASVVTPLGQMSESQFPTLSAQNGTNYGAAFRTLAQAIEADRTRLKAEGYKIWRPLAFFLTDGEPLDADWLQTFKSTLTYDRNTGRGMKSHPIFVPFGFRDAREDVLSKLAYPPEKGRWYLSRATSVPEVLQGVIGVIMKSVVATSSRATSGQKGVHQLALPPAGGTLKSGESAYDEDEI
jgi:uncharacterized protein YegL